MVIDRHLHERYQSPAGAAAYRKKYEKSLTRRLSNARELAMIRRGLAQALAPHGEGGHVLDCPCGAGRLVPTILGMASEVTAADRSAAMVHEARAALRTDADLGRVSFVVASADNLPFEDEHFDAVVCHRLIHHVEDAEDRRRILSELRRVTKDAVLLSFNDASTLKMKVQSIRGRKRRRISWQPEALRKEALAVGLRLETPILRLAGAFSLVATGVFRRVPQR